MATEITVPRLGWSMEEGTFVEWLKDEGEPVQSGDMLFVLEGEKVSTEIESFDAGTLRILPNAPAAGDTVAVGQLLGYLVANGEPAPFEQDGWTEPQPQPNVAPAAATAPEPVAAAQPTGDTPAISPRARRVAEELGFVAAILVVLAFLAIGIIGLNTALRAPDRFGQLLAAGITTWIVLQAYVNVGAVLGLLPITGIPLPFLSYGGSSMVFTLTAYGVLLNIARQTP